MWIKSYQLFYKILIHTQKQLFVDVMLTYIYTPSNKWLFLVNKKQMIQPQVVRGKKRKKLTKLNKLKDLSHGYLGYLWTDKK